MQLSLLLPQVDFDLDETDFESAVANLIPNITDLDTPLTALIPTADAIAHFETELAENNINQGGTPVSFSESDLRNTTLFNVFFDDDIGVEEFVVETLSFGGQNNMTVDGESATFSVTNGILRITFSEADFDDIKIILFDETLNARGTCWEMGLNSQFNCASNELEYMFESLAEAVAFRDSKNSGVSGDPVLAYSLEELAGVTHYSVFNGDGDCPIVNHWYVEAMAFDGEGNYTLALCDDTIEKWNIHGTGVWLDKNNL